MDGTNHSTKSLIAVLCLVSLCALFCLMTGCEEGMVEDQQHAAGPDLTETVNDDIEADATAAENILAEASIPEPDKVIEPDAVVVIADEIAKADPAAETLAEADNAKPEPVIEPEPVVVIADEIAKADPPAEILDETINPEPETLSEAEAVAEPVKEVGFTVPIPTKSLDITQDQTDSATGLDKMHIADAPLLGDNANPLEEDQETQVQEQQVVTEPADSKGFVSRYFVTPGTVVLRFTARNYIILLIAVVCVAAWRTVRKKNSSSAGPQRRTNSNG